MKMNKKLYEGLKFLFLCLALILMLMHFKGMSINKAFFLVGKFALVVAILASALTLLDKLRGVDLKKEEQQRQEIRKKLYSNKKAMIWAIGSIIGFFTIFMIHFYFFSTPEKNDPWIWKFDFDLIKRSYWFLSIVQYGFSSYVFLIGKKVLNSEKGKKICHYLASFFTFSFFTLYLFVANDQPNLILVTSMLCLGITWIQFSFINIHKILKGNMIIK